ncbi:MgtC/SapB family protein [uncultured Clostridium sp.]|uniref:MgtC/SapB family protein n=1 Tax=uncultured Clostridium sp. TaxID=59620 RepID=UPI002605DF62|nr:MgtC/SapB family protein [uncultured Clostridium sp.]
MIMEVGIDTIILRLFIACIIGGIIGFEREKHNRAAGFRTHILVCVGACIISLIEMRMEEEFLKSYYHYGGVGIQVTRGRLAAQVISGIGFLGAGSIIFHKGSIKGLTTAASLWVVACIGISIGYGQIWVAVFGVMIALITLHFLISVQEKFINGKDSYKLIIEYSNKKEALEKIKNVFKLYDVKVKSLELKENDNGHDFIECKIVLSPDYKVGISKIKNAIMINEYIISIKRR